MGEEITKTAKIPYSYSSVSFKGTLTELKAPICVDTTHYPQENDYSFVLSHDHYLACLFGDSGKIHQNFDHTLQDYFHILEQSREKHAQPPKYRKQSQNKPQNQPQMTRVQLYQARAISYRYVPEEYRKLIKAMVVFVTCLHSKNISLSPFSLSNLVIKDDVLKFWLVTFREATFDNRKEDFMGINNVISVLFNNYVPYPSDLVDLTQKMNNYASITDDLLLVNHLAIKSSKERVAFMKDCFDKEKFVPTKNHGLYVFAVLRMGSCIGRTNTYITSAAIFLPLIDCFYHKHAKYIDQVTGKRSNLFDVNQSLLKCCRNMGTHLKDHIPDYRVQFRDLDVEVMIMSVFERPLMRFMEELYRQGLLEYFV